MSFVEDLWPWLGPPGFLEKSQIFKESLLQSMANTSCGSTELKACHNESAEFVLKLIDVASILLAVVVGVIIPLVSKNRSFLHTDDSFFVAAKGFATRVILAIGFVHMLPEGSTALNDPCLLEYPWTKFPFSGFFAMMASLARLLVDFVET
ncbi:hypothetical protein TB1_001227 [Malus domestica]